MLSVCKLKVCTWPIIHLKLEGAVTEFSITKLSAVWTVDAAVQVVVDSLMLLSGLLLLQLLLLL